MMFKVCLWLALWGADPAAIDPARVRALLRDLDAPQKSQRDAAEQALGALGVELLPLLPVLDEGAPAELRLRVARLREGLERRAAAQQVEGTPIRLNGELSLLDALRAIEKQSGNRFAPLDDPLAKRMAAERVKFSEGPRPFWVALDTLLDRADLGLYPYDEEGLIVCERSPTAAPRHGQSAYSAAFRIAPADLTARRDFRDTQGRSLMLTLEVAWEPRLSPIALLVPHQQFTLTDERGRRIAPTAGAETIEINLARGVSAIEVPLAFELPERDARRLAVVKGSLRSMIPGRLETFEFTDLAGAKNAEQRQAGTTVILDRVVKNDSLWEARLRVNFQALAGALESHRQWVFNNECWLVAPDGKTVPYGAFETTRQTAQEVGISYLFTEPERLEGWKLVYRTPVSVRTIDVPFELRELELP